MPHRPEIQFALFVTMDGNTPAPALVTSMWISELWAAFCWMLLLVSNLLARGAGGTSARAIHTGFVVGGEARHGVQSQ